MATFGYNLVGTCVESLFGVILFCYSLRALCQDQRARVIYKLSPRDQTFLLNLMETGLPEIKTPIGADALTNARRSVACPVIGGIQ
jgi:hypothetical protein